MNREKILIIVGDGKFGEGLSAELNKAGYNTGLVKNGTEAVKIMTEYLPNLIVMDISLTGTDSYAVLAERQLEPLLMNIPLFLISTQGVPINMAKIPEKSVKEFIIHLHPDFSDIVDKINRHFGRASSNSKPSTGKKVLWVEDDKLISSILAKKFISSGFDLHYASNGIDALKITQELVPDVIVLDLLLPGMNGFEILQKIKEDPRMKNVPTMILSNLSKPSDIEKSKILGASKFMVKAATSLDKIVEEVKVMAEQHQG